MTFIASLRSEFLKTKRTSVIYLILIAAFVVPFVLVFDHGSPDSSTPNGWDHFYREGFVVFTCLFMPLFFILSSTLLMQIEVRNNAWKQVLASPQRVSYLLLAKFTVMQLLAIAFLLMFNIYMVAGCALIDLIFEVDYLAYLNRWPELLSINLMACGANVGLGALSFWLALRFKNFIAPIAIGFLLWIIGPTAALELKWPHFDKYVFVIPFTIVSKRFEDVRLYYQLLSLGYGILFLSIAYFEFVAQRMPLRLVWRRPVTVVSENHSASSQAI